jgi:hypothetical protein
VGVTVGVCVTVGKSTGLDASAVAVSWRDAGVGDVLGVAVTIRGTPVV